MDGLELEEASGSTETRLAAMAYATAYDPYDVEEVQEPVEEVEDADR